MTNLPNFANKALNKVSVKPLKIVEQMLCDLLAIPASRVRDFSVIHSQPNAVSYEIFSQQIFEKVSAIDEEKLTEPEPQIIRQAIEDSTYCYQHEELCAMFSSLIANACNKDYRKIMHPSFSNTLKCISPYDAMFIKKLFDEQKAIGDGSQAAEAAEYMILSHNSGDALLLHECIVFTDEYFSDFDMQSLSISTLKHLGVVAHSLSGTFTVDKKFTEAEYFKSLEKQYDGTDSYPVARQLLAGFTPYGDALITACSTPPLLNEQTP